MHKKWIIFLLLAVGAALYAISNSIYGVGFLVQIAALFCFYFAFVLILFLPFKSAILRKSAKILKVLAFSAFAFGFLSFICVQALIVSGWPEEYSGEAEVIIVLGAGLRGEQMSAVLTSRMQPALEFLLENPDAVAVVSGGQGDDEDIPEALAMMRFLTQNGVELDRVFMEDKSRNTTQNLLFSIDLLREKGISTDNTVILSNSFHIYRALKLAGAMGVDARGIGAPVPRIGLVPLNSYVREYFSIMKMALVELPKLQK